MRTVICQIIIVGWLVLGVTLGTFRPVMAQNQPALSPQAFFFEEVVGGTLGAILTGLVPYTLYVNFGCSGSNDPLCRESANLLIRPLLFPIAIPPGATLGIWAMGSFEGVEGNIEAAAIGSIVGALGGLLEATAAKYLIDGLFSPDLRDYLASSDAPEYLKRYLPPLIEQLRSGEVGIKEMAIAVLPTVTAAYFGALGFNFNARLRP